VPQTPEKATPELAEGIRSWLAERVSRHKRLEGGVHFVDAVPKNPVSVFFFSYLGARFHLAWSGVWRPVQMLTRCSLARLCGSCCGRRRRWRIPRRSCRWWMYTSVSVGVELLSLCWKVPSHAPIDDALGPNWLLATINSPIGLPVRVKFHFLSWTRTCELQRTH
jgi:hypothetical protein